MKIALDAGTSAVSASLGEPLRHAKQILPREIHEKWKRFSEEEVASFKDNDELLSRVVAKYGLDKSEVQRDVDSFMIGRQIAR
jgi:hypothetical protein